MDIGDTIAPTSDQLDAIDLLTGPRTFTITEVTAGNAEQPVNIHLVEFDRPWRPGKSMRRVLVACWGADASQYVGRRVTLFCDPNVKFGGEAVGGTRISHLSHLDKPKSMPLLVTRGKSMTYKVQPLTEEVARSTSAPTAVRHNDSKPNPAARMVQLMGQHGMTEDTRAQFVNDVLQRKVTGAADLSAEDIGLVVAALEAFDPDDPTTHPGYEGGGS
jgi:hypothetical protein